MSDDLLLAGLTAGDAELSVAFVRRFQGPVFGVALTVSAPDARDRPDGGQAATPARRRRRAVGPAGAPSAVPDGTTPDWAQERSAPEDDDERLLREVMICRIAPVSEQMILSFIAERVLEQPKSY